MLGILTSEWHAEHPFAGRNTQHMGLSKIWFKGQGKDKNGGKVKEYNFCLLCWASEEIYLEGMRGGGFCVCQISPKVPERNL